MSPAHQPAAGDVYSVTRMDQMRALAHPLRLRLLEVFALAPRTTKQAAEFLGENPTRLYHHVALLERAGLLELRKTRRNRGTVEKYGSEERLARFQDESIAWLREWARSAESGTTPSSSASVTVAIVPAPANRPRRRPARGRGGNS